MAEGVKRLFWIAGFLRLLLVGYGEWQDAHLEVPYTDIDYYVFSDAASLLQQGKSPFDRSTYRYSPLLAFILLPNSCLHRSWGKLLFSLGDLLVAYFISRILELRGVPQRMQTVSVASWLFNPFTFTVATRGNCEALVCAVVLWMVVCLMTGRLVEAAIWYGLVVHVRIYPIIYVLPILVLLDNQYGQAVQICHQQLLTSSSLETHGTKERIIQSVRQLLSRQRIIFGFVSGGVFFTLTGTFYYTYGCKYLQEALFYHLTRSDHRHNFSIYFYYVYLNEDMIMTVVGRFLAFLPQMMVQLIFVLLFAKDFSFCIFVQTVAFVSFNKVITAQYFVWFFCLFPLILPFTSLKVQWNGALCMGVWTMAQLHWLGWAYLLEFKGRNVFLQLWTASIVFFAANVYVLVQVIRHHSFCPLFVKGNLSSYRMANHVKEL